MANELRVGIVADASSLEGAMADAGASVETLAARVKTASNNMAEAQKAFGSAAAQGNAQAKAVLAEYSQQLEVAQSAQEQFAASATQVSEALRVESASANVAAESINRVGVSSRQAATAGIGILEGRMMSGNRAAAAFLSTTLGLGPVLQAAFPVIGALALGEVLIDIGKSAYEAYEKFISLDSATEKLNDDFHKLQQTDIINVHSIEAATERLGEANEKATNLRETAQQLHDISLSGLFSALGQGQLGGIASSIGGLLSAKTASNDSTTNVEQSMQLGIKQLEQLHELRVAKIEAAHAGDSGLPALQKINAEEEKHLALVREAAQYTQRRDQALGNPAPKDTLLLGYQEQQIKGEAAAQRSKVKPEYDPIKDMLESDKLAASDNEKILDSMRENFEQATRAENEVTAQKRRADEAATEEFKKNREEEIRAAEEATNAISRAAQEQYEATERTIKFKVQTGRLSPQQGTQQSLAAVNQSETEQTRAASDVQSQYTPSLGGDQAIKWQAQQDKITQITQKAEQQRTQIEQQAALQQQQIQTRAFSFIDNQFNQVMDKWLQGTESMSRAWTALGDNIAIAVVNGLAKAAAAELVGLTIHKSVLAEKGLADAKAAAKGAYQAVVGIPYIGPVLAPIAAATAFAAVAAFETGADYVPSTGLAMIHEGERIIPSGQNAEITKAIAGGKGGQGGDNHFHYAPNIQGIDGASVAGMAQRHGQTFQRQAMKQLRLSGARQGG